MSEVDTLKATSSEGTADGEWRIRLYRDGDVPGIVALYNEAAELDGREAHITEEDYARQLNMPIVDPYKQMVVAESTAAEGKIVGYARAVHIDDPNTGERIYQAGVVAHPDARAGGLEKALAARIVRIMREHEADPNTTPAEQVNVLAGVSEKSRSTLELYREIGLREIRHGWTMERSLLDPIPEPKDIVGVTIRPYRRPEDNVAARTAFNQSFIDHFEHHELPQEVWDSRMESSGVRTDLSLLAEVEGEPGTFGGFCVCEIYAEENERKGRKEGWIGLLGTTRSWRGVGLGKSLLLRGMLNLKAAGVETALLGVDAESPTGANRLYESVGFTVREHEMMFKSPLSELKI
ncbi:MAG TPA: GNAT family N-acetyltransferase [Chloroflexia bacterium]|nr:GNAT family N-acetyltransferase [Chloroflexia bacterium]